MKTIEQKKGKKWFCYWQENCLNCILNGRKHIPDVAQTLPSNAFTEKKGKCEFWNKTFRIFFV